MAGTQKPLHILLTNDDGINAQGLLSLHRRLRQTHHVSVIAPDRERSAVGHGITLHQPLRATQVPVNGNSKGWAVSGTPADCVKLAVLELMEQRPDVVISGINLGANVGVNMNYSGTVAAAKEATIYGLKSIAISIQGNGGPNLDSAAQFAAHVAPMVVANGLPQGTFLNINLPSVPAGQIAGVRVSRQAIDIYDEYFEKRQDPRNESYYWQCSESHPDYRHQDADGAALLGNFITITPVRCDMTDYNALEKIKEWDFESGFDLKNDVT
jgi:5'-nucleotidase